MPVTVTQVPADLEQFVDAAIATGRYSSSNELVCDAIRLLRQRDEKLQSLRSSIQEGASSPESEDLVLDGDEGIDRFFDDLLHEGGMGKYEQPARAPSLPLPR